MAQTKLYLLATLKNRTLQKQQEGKTNIEAKSEVNNEQEPYFQELMATYHINEDLRKRIEDYKLAFGTMKTFISQFRIPPETPVDK
ncbi:MAG: hypothetical protein LBP53_07830 [Candidatus Peribacteria bacterium]|jgi:hypothetical protein|nr:hypothetical protein [Candidatus Peribacteria bacterium]